MSNNKVIKILHFIFVGKRYSEFKSTDEQSRYMLMNIAFMIVAVPLITIGITLIGIDPVRMAFDFTIAGMCLVFAVLLRTKIPLIAIPVLPLALFGAYCIFLVSQGTLYHWTAAWIFIFPIVAVFLGQMAIGLILSALVFAGLIFVMFLPIGAYMLPDIRIRFLSTYTLILILTFTSEYFSIRKAKREKELNANLIQERDIVQTMKDNIPHGVFLMDQELKILPQYSKPLINILSYYDAELTGKNFLDILAVSLNSVQLQTMKNYFSMMFSKSKTEKVMEKSNPIHEFDYKTENRTKILSTRFNLIEQAGSESLIIGIIQDITKEKEFEKELQAQRETRQMDAMNMIDVIQIDPLVLEDFIDDIESELNYLNLVIKNNSLNKKQIITIFRRSILAIKSNTLILELKSFGKNLSSLEDSIQSVIDADNVNEEDFLNLTVQLEALVQEKDYYKKIASRIESFKTSPRIDAVFIRSLAAVAEKTAMETGKKVTLEAGQIDMEILGSKLRKPIKEILFQFVKHSVCHSIESAEERIKKNKSSEGHLTVDIKKEEDKAIIIFSDDGRGLDWKKIEARYRELYPKAKNINNKTLLSVIFLPEFSASDEADLISGRKTGLSLVKEIVQKNNGSVNIKSAESGLSWKIILTIPE